MNGKYQKCVSEGHRSWDGLDKKTREVRLTEMVWTCTEER